MATGHWHFSLNLIRQTGIDNSNVISPLSISVALGMLLQGAKHDTASQILEAISNNANPEDIHQNFAKILASKNTALKMANKIYFAKNVSLKTQYKDKITEFYEGNFEMEDFQKADEAAIRINKFVSDSTDGEIPNIVNAEMLTENTRLVLLAVLLFENEWIYPFTLLPSNLPFHITPGISKEIPMMETDITCVYADTPEFQYLEMPYINRFFSLIIILPKERFGLSNLLKVIDIDLIMNLMLTPKEMDGKVTIPKFDTKSSFNLIETLKALGIVDAFDPAKADFSGITDNNIYVAEALHECFIKIDEEGTKAGSATAMIEEDMMFVESKPSFSFRADHPFLYLLVDRNQIIYFIGTFYN